MKRKTVGGFGVLLGGALLACIALQGANFCAGQTAAPAKAAPAVAAKPAGAPAVPAAGRGPNERFYAIQQVLDAGGSFYLYADTKDALRQYVANLQTVLGNPDMPPQVAMGAVIANQVIDRLGLYGIQDVGVSTVPDGDLNRTKIFVSSSEGRAKGFLSLMGGDPHPIKMLDRVPADTELLFTADLDAQAAWALVRQVVQDVAGAAGQAQMDQALAMVNAQTGLDVATIIPSLGGEVAIVGTQNPAEKLTLPPMGNSAPISLDSPRIALMVRVTKDDLYQGLKQAFAKQGATVGAEATEGKLRYIAITAKPNPVWPVTPVLATDGEYVYFATHLDYMKTLAAGAGPGLRTSEEFKQLSTGLPAEANGCTFVSMRLQKAMQDAMQAAAGAAGAGNPVVGLPGGPNGAPRRGAMDKEAAFPLAMMNQMIAGQGAPSGSLSLRINRPDGVLIVNRSKGNVAAAMPSLFVAPVAVLAAIAVPNFLEAQTRAKVARVQSDTRSLATAIEAFNIDMNKYPPSSPDPAQNLFGAAAVQRTPALKQVSTFQLMTLKELGMSGTPGVPNVGVAAPGNEPLFMPLTSPVAYITAIPSDVFAPAEKTPFCYYSTPDNKYLLWSAGPDQQYDVTTEDLTRIFAASAPDPRQALTAGVGASGRAFTFDSTNGTTSVGDVWRLGGYETTPGGGPGAPTRPAAPGGPGIPAPVGLPGGMR